MPHVLKIRLLICCLLRVLHSLTSKSPPGPACCNGSPPLISPLHYQNQPVLLHLIHFSNPHLSRPLHSVWASCLCPSLSSFPTSSGTQLHGLSLYCPFPVSQNSVLSIFFLIPWRYPQVSVILEMFPSLSFFMIPETFYTSHSLKNPLEFGFYFCPEMVNLQSLLHNNWWVFFYLNVITVFTKMFILGFQS